MMTEGLGPRDALTSQRLGVRHLLLWMLFTALVMGGYQLMWLLRDDAVQDTRLWQATRLVYAVVYGAALTALAITLRRWLRREAGLAPGHCFLVMAGIGALVDGAAMLLAQTISGWIALPYGAYGETLIYQSVGHALVALLAAPVFITAGLPNRWKPLMYSVLVMFLLYAALCFALLSMLLLGSIPQGVPWTLPSKAIVVGTAICLPLLLWAVWRDLLEQIHHDWLHWLGILAALALTVLELGQFVHLVLQL